MELEFHSPTLNENKGEIQPEVRVVESESDIEIESSLTDLTLARGAALPPISDDSPLGRLNADLANVVPVGQSLAGMHDPRAIHTELIAAAGPRLEVGEALNASVGFIARALHEGCDPDRDMLPVVIERTHIQGASPITTWRYFFEPWKERRASRAKRAASPQRPESRDDAA